MLAPGYISNGGDDVERGIAGATFVVRYSSLKWPQTAHILAEAHLAKVMSVKFDKRIIAICAAGRKAVYVGLF